MYPRGYGKPHRAPVDSKTIVPSLLYLQVDANTSDTHSSSSFSRPGLHRGSPVNDRCALNTLTQKTLRGLPQTVKMDASYFD
ncbi:hypothetical protein Y1Q_0014923 [Alligator mississippiensis]|uniref:Uncharacterized protein n=1 Tax=Alligator mississippiensis TaxID=8496 RepID=A0A151N8P4_ALLMI|nr:hypothetical protein Y1Q_0014923 [Alligator mississippiensis]